MLLINLNLQVFKICRKVSQSSQNLMVSIKTYLDIHTLYYYALINDETSGLMPTRALHIVIPIQSMW